MTETDTHDTDAEPLVPREAREQVDLAASIGWYLGFAGIGALLALTAVGEVLAGECAAVGLVTPTGPCKTLTFIADWQVVAGVVGGSFLLAALVFEYWHGVLEE